MSISERMKEYIKSKGLNVAEYERNAGFSNGAVDKMSEGTRKSTYNRISNASPDLNIEWLRTGKGEMILKGSERSVTRVSNKDSLENVLIRFFSVTPTATFQEFCSGADREVDTISVKPEDGEVLNDSYCVFEVFGRSMAPQIQSKARVLCYEIQPTKWHTLHDCVVVIAYLDRFVIKRIVRNNLATSNYIILASDNPEFPKQETVQLSDIRCIYKASRIISQKIS